MRPIQTLLGLGLAAAALSACGLKGDLVRPTPMWGNPPLEGPNDPRVLKEKADKEQAEKDRKAAEREKERADRDAAAAAAAASPTPTPTAAPK